MKSVFRPHAFTVIIAQKYKSTTIFQFTYFWKRNLSFFGLFHSFCYFIQIQLHGCEFCE